MRAYLRAALLSLAALVLVLGDDQARAAPPVTSAVVRIPSHGASATIIETRQGCTLLLGCAHAFAAMHADDFRIQEDARAAGFRCRNQCGSHMAARIDHRPAGLLQVGRHAVVRSVRRHRSWLTSGLRSGVFLGKRYRAELVPNSSPSDENFGAPQRWEHFSPRQVPARPPFCARTCASWRSPAR